MRDADFERWLTAAEAALKAAGAAPADPATLEHAYDDGLEPEDLPGALARYRPAAPRPVTGTVSDLLAEHARATGSDD